MTRDWAERGSGVAGRAQVGVGRGEAGSAQARERERELVWARLLGSWAGLVWGLGLFSTSYSFLFLNYTQTKLNSNSNLNSTLALNQIKDMLKHDATTKI